MRTRRETIGLPAGDDAPLLLHPDGSRVSTEQVPLHLRRARLQRVGIETNGEYCKSLLRSGTPPRRPTTRSDVLHHHDGSPGAPRPGLPSSSGGCRVQYADGVDEPEPAAVAERLQSLQHRLPDGARTCRAGRVPPGRGRQHTRHEVVLVGVVDRHLDLGHLVHVSPARPASFASRPGSVSGGAPAAPPGPRDGEGTASVSGASDPPITDASHSSGAPDGRPHGAAGCGHPARLAQRDDRVRQVFQHLDERDQVERAVGERELVRVADPQVGAPGTACSASASGCGRPRARTRSGPAAAAAASSSPAPQPTSSRRAPGAAPARTRSNSGVSLIAREAIPRPPRPRGRSAPASPSAGRPTGRCPRPWRRSRTAGTGRAARAARTSPPRRSGA